MWHTHLKEVEAAQLRDMSNHRRFPAASGTLEEHSEVHVEIACVFHARSLDEIHQTAGYTLLPVRSDLEQFIRGRSG